MNILILGGTAEARELANRLVDLGHTVTTSLAGRTRNPILPRGNIRIGHFGGIPNLIAYLHAARIDYLVDATHPYADRISFNALSSARSSGIPLLRLIRPAWEPPLNTPWTHIKTVLAAARRLPPHATALLTIGHSGLEHFRTRSDCHFVIRSIEPPRTNLPPYTRLVQTRPPYTQKSEMALMQREKITHLITKNSGGQQTAAKIDAAQQLGIEIFMISRPVYSPAQQVETVEAALNILIG